MQVTSTLRQANVLRLRFQVGATGMTGPAGPQGNPGPANSLAIGTVSTLPYGSPATATITGAPPSQTLDLGLPMGAQGPSGSVTDGDKGDIVVSVAGTVWTIDAGAVDETKLGAGAATTDKLGPAAVTEPKIADDAVSNSKLANMASARIKGRATVGSGDPEDLTATQVTALLDAFAGDAGSGGTKGLVPAPASGDNAAGRVLDASGSFVSLVNKHMPMGSVVDCVSASFTTVTSSSLIIPLDDTKPQSSEGTQILSVSIAPKSTTNKLRVLVVLPFSLAGGAASALAALFVDGAADSISATYRYDAAGSGGMLVLATEFAPGTTSSVTLSIRIGVDIAGRAVVINGITGPARLLGGASEAGIYIQEIKA